MFEYVYKLKLITTIDKVARITILQTFIKALTG